MRRSGIRAGLAGLLLLVAVLTGAMGGRLTQSERVYTVGDVQTGLRSLPHAWIGRTIWVRAVVLGFNYAWARGTVKTIPPSIDPLHPPPGLDVRIHLVPVPSHPTSMNTLANNAFDGGPDLVVAPKLNSPSSLLLSLEAALHHVPLVGCLVPAPPIPPTLFAAKAFQLAVLPPHGQPCSTGTCLDAILIGMQM